jgi:hypothetical protein
LENPDYFKIDYKNIKKYIENPWPDEVDDDNLNKEELDDYESSEDIESIPKELRIR